MINKVRISNFKGIKNIELNQLSKFNIIGGKNNAGKSTVLEAIFMFYDRLGPDFLLKQYSWRGITELQVVPEEIFFPIFNGYDSSKKITIEIATGSEKDTLDIVYSDPFSHNEINDKKIFLENLDGVIKTDDNLVSSNTKLMMTVRHSDARYKKESFDLGLSLSNLSFNIKHATRHNMLNCKFLSSKGYQNPIEVAVQYSELDINGESEKLIDFLRIIEPKIKGISNVSLANNKSMLYVDIGINKKIPMSFMGDGISRLTSILLAILTTKNGIVFIDEIENGIHYSVQNKIWKSILKAADENNCQIFVSTHSYEFLNACIEGTDEIYRDKLAYFRLEQIEDKTQAKRLTYDNLKTSVSNGWEVR